MDKPLLDKPGQPQVNTLVGPYRMEVLLGEGGMGMVWLAARADGLYQRKVALKLLRPGLADPNLRLRFSREREILARLAHPNIARLLDAGIGSEGQPYLALEYVEGIPITDYCLVHGLSVDTRLKLFLQVCEAVSHAHANLIVHRDLKPSNILVTPTGEVRLLDFGIAKLLDDPEPAPRAPAHRSARLHPALRRARTGARRAGHHHDRCVFAGRGAVRTAGRDQALPAAPADRRRMGAGDPRGRPAQAFASPRNAPPMAAATTVRKRGARRAGSAATWTTSCSRRWPSSPSSVMPRSRHFPRTCSGTCKGRPVQARPQSWGYRLRKYASRHRWALGARRRGRLRVAGRAGRQRLAGPPGDARNRPRPGHAGFRDRPVRQRRRGPAGQHLRCAQAAGRRRATRRTRAGRPAAGARRTARRDRAPAHRPGRLPGSAAVARTPGRAADPARLGTTGAEAGSGDRAWPRPVPAGSRARLPGHDGSCRSRPFPHRLADAAAGSRLPVAVRTLPARDRRTPGRAAAVRAFAGLAPHGEGPERHRRETCTTWPWSTTTWDAAIRPWPVTTRHWPTCTNTSAPATRWRRLSRTAGDACSGPVAKPQRRRPRSRTRWPSPRKSTANSIPVTLGIRRQLVALQVDQENYARAEQQIVPLLELTEKALGPTHRETGLAWNTRGVIAWQRGHLDEAIVDIGRAVRIWRGPERFAEPAWWPVRLWHGPACGRSRGGGAQGLARIEGYPRRAIRRQPCTDRRHRPHDRGSAGEPG